MKSLVELLKSAVPSNISIDFNAVNPCELGNGIKTEMEHTDDPVIAMQIALDHLAEDPMYYTKLQKIEND